MSQVRTGGWLDYVPDNTSNSSSPRIQYRHFIFQPNMQWSEPPAQGQLLCKIKPRLSENEHFILLAIQGPYLDGAGMRYWVLKVQELSIVDYKAMQKKEINTSFIIWDEELNDGGVMKWNYAPKRMKSRMELLMEQVI